jgi:hypothetical protein
VATFPTIELSSLRRRAGDYPYARSEADGLLSYGTTSPTSYARPASWQARSLKGAKPAELLVQQQPIKFDLVINLNTAKAIALMCLSTFNSSPMR